MLGITASIVTVELLNYHAEQTVTRAIQRALRSHSNAQAPVNVFNLIDKIWVWYESTKGSERSEWVKATITKSHQHYLEARGLYEDNTARGPMMRPAYEDVRLAPSSDVTQERMNSSLEEELGIVADWGRNGLRGGSKGPPNVNALL